MAVRPLSPAESRAASIAAGRIAFWGLAIYAGGRLAAMVLDSMSMAAVVAQAIIAELGAGRLGVAWSDPLAPVPTAAAIARRALVGAAVGAFAACAVAAFLASTGAVMLIRATPDVSPLAVSLVTAGLYAMRDELLLHGVVMRATITVAPAVPRVLACGITSAAAALGENAAPRAVLAQGLIGVIFGLLWVRDRGAWQAWGAHTAWLFGRALLLEGGLYDARTAANSWGGGNGGALTGSAAVVALLPLAGAAIVMAARSGRQHSPARGGVG